MFHDVPAVKNVNQLDIFTCGKASAKEHVEEVLW